MKKSVIIIVIAAAVLVVVAVLFFRPKPADGLTLYYGQECPHCANLEAFIQSNKLDEVVKIERKEVYHNERNSFEMGKTAQKCGLTGDSLGVPFLYDGAKCYVGEVEARDYLFQYVK